MTAMNTIAAPHRLTLAEYKARPEGLPKCEFERGALIPMTQPSPQHQDVLLVLCYALRGYVRQNKLGRVFMEPDVHLSEDEWYIPDIAYLSDPHMDLYDKAEKSIHGPPDLVIEITSSRPSRDRVDKFVVYFHHRVAWYWLVDPETLAIEEYRATADGYLRTASVATGQEFKPSIFPEMALNLATLLDESPSRES